MFRNVLGAMVFTFGMSAMVWHALFGVPVPGDAWVACQSEAVGFFWKERRAACVSARLP